MSPPPTWVEIALALAAWLGLVLVAVAALGGLIVWWALRSETRRPRRNATPGAVHGPRRATDAGGMGAVLEDPEDRHLPPSRLVPRGMVIALPREPAPAPRPRKTGARKAR